MLANRVHVRSFVLASAGRRALSSAAHRVVVIGAGAGGLASAASLAEKLGKKGDVAIVDPAQTHYYQPLW
jgi:sulfide:quinone oxidoreductase